MAELRCQISVSLDGFVAGPNQSVQDPLGEGGMDLHQWAIRLEAWRRPHGQEGGEVNPSTEVMEEALSDVGATLMGRNMFGGGPGDWSAEEPWNGWWGENPPFHTPVFVLTHHSRQPLEMEGGTSFHFVTEGVERAVELAMEAAEGKDVSVGGGAETIRECLAAGLLDELQLNVVPILLGDGARLLDGLGDAGIELEQTRAIEAPGVAHLRYSVKR
jgi:dihydrofolate reductase